MLVDFIVEGFAEGNDVFTVGSWLILHLWIGEPQVHGIKKMKTRAVNHLVGAGLLFRTKENGGGKNSLETFDDASIMPAVFREVKELENFCSRSESHNAVLLADSERGNPNRDEPVLAVW